MHAHESLKTDLSYRSLNAVVAQTKIIICS